MVLLGSQLPDDLEEDSKIEWYDLGSEIVI